MEVHSACGSPFYSQRLEDKKIYKHYLHPSSHHKLTILIESHEFQAPRLWLESTNCLQLPVHLAVVALDAFPHTGTKDLLLEEEKGEQKKKKLHF